MRPTRCARVRRLASIPAVLAVLAASSLQADDANAARAGITITSPSGGGKVSGTTNVRVSARNPAVLEKVTFRVDGRAVGTDWRAPYEHVLDTDRLAPGPHNLKVTGHEEDGSRGSAQVTIHVTREISDAEGPALMVPAPLHRPLAGSVPIAVEASDPSGIDRVEFLVDGELRWTERKAPYLLNGDRGTWETTLDADGPHALEVRAHDGAGNLTATRTEVVVANDAPAPDPTPAPPAPEPVRAPAGPTAPVAPPPGPATPTPPLTPTPVATPMPAPAPAPAPTPTSPPYAATVRTVAISAPADSGTVSGSTPFLATVSDADGLERVELFAGGSLVATETTAPFGFGGGDGAPELDLSIHPAGALELRAVAHFDDETTAEAVVSVVVVTDTPPTPPAPDPGDNPGPAVSAASWYVAPGGSDAGPGTVEAPFRTLDRAYRAASPGHVVQVASGSYPKQTIEVDSAKTSSADVVFRPVSGATVSVSDRLEIFGRHVEIQGIQTDGFYIRPGAEDVTLRDVVSTDAGFITEADDIRLLGGEIKGVDSLDGLQVKASGSDEPRNLVIDGLLIRDITRTGNPSAHTECIQFTAGVDVAIRNSRFLNCSTQGVFLKEGLGGQIDNVLIENNWFGDMTGYNTLILDDGVSDVTVRNNSFAKAPRLGSGVGTSNLRAFGNAGVMRACGSGVTYRNNVWSDAACGSGDVRTDPMFVDAGGFDLRLRAGSPAIDRASAAESPKVDMFGTARPQGGAPDAGAHERG